MPKLKLSPDRLRCLLPMLLVFLPLQVAAATYYASPAGSGSACSSTSPCSLSGGLGKLAGGDTLILRDGTYTQLIGYYGTFPPNGISASQRTVIRAEHVGQAIIDGQYQRPAVYLYDGSNTRNYIEFDGIHFRRGSGGVFFLGGSYNYVHNCGFEDGDSSSDTGEFPITTISEGGYTLVEDSWVWGRGRYGLYTSSVNGGTNHVIFRRVVVRQDSVPPYVSAGFRFYNANTNTCQNCIVIDGRYDGASEAVTFGMGGGSSTSEPNHLWDSCISLNNSGQSGLSGWVNEDLTTQATWRNSVIWGVPSRGISSSGNPGSGKIILDRLTIGQAASYAVNNSNGTLTWNLSNSLISVPSGGTAFNGLSSVTNTDYYLASGGSRGQAVGTAITLATFNEGLKYLPRIEAGSTLATAGVGANIVYQQGTTGTYYGQTGWNTTTSTQLWPLPNEGMWAAKMKAYTASGPGGNRGFAALSGSTSTPLTDYIWGYLGNPKPNIYGDSNRLTAPQSLYILQ